MRRFLAYLTDVGGGMQRGAWSRRCRDMSRRTYRRNDLTSAGSRRAGPEGRHAPVARPCRCAPGRCGSSGCRVRAGSARCGDRAGSSATWSSPPASGRDIARTTRKGPARRYAACDGLIDVVCAKRDTQNPGGCAALFSISSILIPAQSPSIAIVAPVAVATPRLSSLNPPVTTSMSMYFSMFGTSIAT
jgi:hypothetical protein